MNDDLDEEIIASEDGFDEFAQSSGITDKIRNNPGAKIGVVVAGVALVAGALFLFGGEQIEEAPSQMPGGSKVTSVPGADEEVSPAYAEAVEQQNEEDLARALEEGGSSIPVPIETPETRLEVPEVEEQGEDPLHRWRMLQEERVEREMSTKGSQVAEPVTVLDAEQQNEAVQKLAESMSEQMNSVLESVNQGKTFTTRTYRQEKAETADNGESGAQNRPPTGADQSDFDSNFEEDTEEEVLIAAGKIYYAQMLLEANSDAPSVVLAQMLSGPLKGWKLLGSFSAIENLEMISITFDTAVNDAGDQYSINGIMLDPDSGLSAMSTEVNHRYLQRIVFPAASAFVTGFSEAIAETGRTSVYVDGGQAVESEEEKDEEQEVATGVNEAAEEISTILDEMGDVPIEIIIDAGTPIAVFFSENVVKEEGDI